jgi:hypothetical protein
LDNFDPDAFLASAPPSQSPNSGQQTPNSGGFDPDAFLNEGQSSEQSSDTLGTIRAGLEGVGQGLAGPFVPLAEKLAGISYKSQREAQVAHPIIHGIGEGTGLVGGALLGEGLGAVMGKAGELATGAVGLSHVGEAADLANMASKATDIAKAATKVGAIDAVDLTAQAAQMSAKASEAAKGVSWGQKVGSSAAQQAAEMSVLQGNDEASKSMMDPKYSSESAIANIGMAAALGAGTGAVLTGVVSPLWSATAGPKVDKMWNAIKNKADGSSVLALPDEIESNLKTLNIEPNAIQRADISEHPTANGYIKDLTRAEHPQVLDAKDDLVNQVSNSVFEPLGTNIEEMRSFDNHADGEAVGNKIKEPIKAKFAPLIDAMEQRDKDAIKILPNDESKLQLRDGILEDGMTNTSGNSDSLKYYTKYADRVLEQDTMHHFNQLDTELRNEIISAKSFANPDYNKANALQAIRDKIKTWKNGVLEDDGVQTLSKSNPGRPLSEIRAEWQNTNKQYAIAEKWREELSNNFNINSNGWRDFIRKLDDTSGEQITKKFSIKNNIDGANFLKENMPEAFNQVVMNERKQLLKPAIKAAEKKGDNPIDINKLNDIISDKKKGNQQYLNLVLPQQFMDRAAAARNVLNATTKVKDSGTPAGLWAVLRGVGSSALGAISYMTGHGPMASILAGEAAATIGKKAPEAYKLAYLKFMGSSQPVKAEGIKAMVDFFHESAQGTNTLAKATKAVLKSGVQVLGSNMMPTQSDRNKLDKQVSKAETSPENFMKQQMQGDTGHYLPDHQAAMAQTTTAAVQYLAQLKPRPTQPSPLDKPIAPTASQEARYNRALDIAQQPAVVLQHLKDGTLQASDIQDINAMYPGLYQKMVTNLSNEMNSKQASDEPIPYRTKIGMGLFMGHPLDSTMTPTAIQNAQLTHLPANAQQSQQSQSPQKTKSNTSKLGKTDKSYQTPTQTAESDRANRD